MNKKLKKYLEDYSSAIQNLDDVFQRSVVDDVVIDATIKRFELCYKLSWKLIKSYLNELGLSCKNPRECFKYAKNNGLIEDELEWLNMIEDRNLLAHTYSVTRSRNLYSRIKNGYYPELASLTENIAQELQT